MRVSSLFVVGFLIAELVTSAGAAERDVQHVFAVQPGCLLRIDTYRGEITIDESDDTTVQMTIHMEVGGDTEAEAERVLRGLQLDVTEANNVVSIFARNPRETRARWVWREDEQIGLFYRITVPRHCNVEVKNSKGNVTIGRLQGRMIAEVKTGTVFFRGVDGSVQANVDEGDLTISRCTGDVTAHVRVGHIQTGLIGGAAHLKTDSGSVDVMMTSGGLQAEATAGDLTIGFARELQSGASLKSSGGNIFVRIDPATDCAVDAASRWGRVQCDLPLAVDAGANGKRKLRGRLNDGGPVLVLQADGGNVSIEGGKAAFD